MALDAARLLAAAIPPRNAVLTARDASLYALAVGAGRDPLDPMMLRFVAGADQRCYPIYATMVGRDTRWLSDPVFGISLGRMVNGGTRLRLGAPLPIEGDIVSRQRVLQVSDLGEAGAVVVVERRLLAPDGELLALVETDLFCRGDGGFGGVRHPSPFVALPPRAPDHRLSWSVPLDAALLFRLTGDYNAIHADPIAAQRAGFPRPILHGLATLGMATLELVRAGICDVARTAGADALFAAPVVPGDTLTIDAWDEPDAIAFRVIRPDGRVAIDAGRLQQAAVSAQSWGTGE